MNTPHHTHTSYIILTIKQTKKLHLKNSMYIRGYGILTIYMTLQNKSLYTIYLLSHLVFYFVFLHIFHKNGIFQNKLQLKSTK